MTETGPGARTGIGASSNDWNRDRNCDKKEQDGARTRQERDRKQGQEDRNRDMDRTEEKREGLIGRKWAGAVACLERETDTVRHLFLAFGCDICVFLLYCRLHVL